MRNGKGFTLIELLVVMAILGMLLSLALPRYFAGLERSKVALLKQDLAVMRQAIDQYRADRGQFPATLQALTEKGYLRDVPQDPITESRDTWLLDMAPAEGESGVRDVHSGASGSSAQGDEYGAL